MAKYFRITEIDATTFKRMTGNELDCLQVARSQMIINT